MNQEHHRLSQLELNSLGKVFSKNFAGKIEAPLKTILFSFYQFGVVLLILVIAFWWYLPLIGGFLAALSLM